MTRIECLDHAAKAVLTDRSKQYGSPEDCFSLIASLWSGYLGHPVSSCDVAAMMALLKIVRAKQNPHHDDSWTDLAGYAACGAECAAGMYGSERVEGVPYGGPDMAEEMPPKGESAWAWRPPEDYVGRERVWTSSTFRFWRGDWRGGKNGKYRYVK